MESKILSFVPKIEEQDIQEVYKAVSSGWGDNREVYIKSLEESLKKITNRKYALAVSHGTDAIQIALSALNLQSGDEVIVPDLTWVACVSPIIHLGLTPVFVNVDDTMCIDPESFKQSITPKTKAVLAVDLAGSLPNWDEIIKIARENKIIVIEDAAESLGGFYKKNPAGSFGDVAILSFSGTKVVTGGQGGAVLTDNEEIYNRMKLLFHHGIDQKITGKYYWSTLAGYNFQISNIQAALINSQLSRLTNLVAFKENLFNLYSEELRDLKSISLITPNNFINSSYWLIVAKLDPQAGIGKEEIINRAQKLGLDLRPFFYLLSSMPPFAKYKFEPKINRLKTVELSDFGICLPYGYDMDASKVKKISIILRRVIT